MKKLTQDFKFLATVLIQKKLETLSKSSENEKVILMKTLKKIVQEPIIPWKTSIEFEIKDTLNVIKKPVESNPNNLHPLLREKLERLEMAMEGRRIAPNEIPLTKNKPRNKLEGLILSLYEKIKELQELVKDNPQLLRYLLFLLGLLGFLLMLWKFGLIKEFLKIFKKKEKEGNELFKGSKKYFKRKPPIGDVYENEELRNERFEELRKLLRKLIAAKAEREKLRIQSELKKRGSKQKVVRNEKQLQPEIIDLSKPEVIDISKPEIIDLSKKETQNFVQVEKELELNPWKKNN